MELGLGFVLVHLIDAHRDIINFPRIKELTGKNKVPQRDRQLCSQDYTGTLLHQAKKTLQK